MYWDCFVELFDTYHPVVYSFESVHKCPVWNRKTEIFDCRKNYKSGRNFDPWLVVARLKRIDETNRMALVRGRSDSNWPSYDRKCVSDGRKSRFFGCFRRFPTFSCVSGSRKPASAKINVVYRVRSRRVWRTLF